MSVKEKIRPLAPVLSQKLARGERIVLRSRNKSSGGFQPPITLRRSSTQAARRSIMCEISTGASTASAAGDQAFRLEPGPPRGG